MVSIIGFKFYFVSLYVQRQQAIVPDILRSVDANLFQKGYFQLEMVVFFSIDWNSFIVADDWPSTFSGREAPLE